MMRHSCYLMKKALVKNNNKIMRVKIVIINLLLLLASCTKSQNQKKPEYICKGCGSFDLSKITFNENIDHLVSKTKVFTTVFVNDGCGEKRLEEFTKADQVCAFKYDIYNQPGNILGKGLFTFSGKFQFDNLKLLLNSQKKMISYNAVVNYDGDIKSIDQFIDFITNKLKIKPKSHVMIIGSSLVYQWDTPSFTYQLYRSIDKEEEESIIDGKTTVENYYYITFTVQNKALITDKTQYVINHNESFVIFGERDFKK